MNREVIIVIEADVMKKFTALNDKDEFVERNHMNKGVYDNMPDAYDYVQRRDVEMNRERTGYKRHNKYQVGHVHYIELWANGIMIEKRKYLGGGKWVIIQKAIDDLEKNISNLKKKLDEKTKQLEDIKRSQDTMTT